MLTVQSHWDQLVLIKSVDQWVRIDAHGSRVKDYLVDAGQFLEEEEHTWAYQNVYLNRSAFNDDAHLKVASTPGPTRSKVRLTEL